MGGEQIVTLPYVTCDCNQSPDRKPLSWGKVYVAPCLNGDVEGGCLHPSGSQEAEALEESRAGTTAWGRLIARDPTVFSQALQVRNGLRPPKIVPQTAPRVQTCGDSGGQLTFKPQNMRSCFPCLQRRHRAHQESGKPTSLKAPPGGTSD